MRVTCPNCLTEYDVPDEAIAGRPRTVRCAHCGHQWRHGAPVEPTAQNPAPEAAPLIDVPPLLPPDPPPPVVTPQPSFMQRPRPTAAPAPPPPRRKFGPAIIALLILALVIVALAAHRPIMHAWPASTGFYNALGLR